MLTLQTRARRRRRDDWHRSDGGVWLPGAADVPRVAGDPMRGAGMVRRGMGFGFEPAGCCCGEGCGDYGPMLHDARYQYIVVSVDGVVGQNFCYGPCSAADGDYEFSEASFLGYGTADYGRRCFAQWRLVRDGDYGIEVWGITFELSKTLDPVTYKRHITFAFINNLYGCSFDLTRTEEGVFDRWSNTDGATWSLVGITGYDVVGKCATIDATASVTIYDEPPV